MNMWYMSLLLGGHVLFLKQKLLNVKAYLNYVLTMMAITTYRLPHRKKMSLPTSMMCMQRLMGLSRHQLNKCWFHSNSIAEI